MDPASKSTLGSNEASFPRGGASVLTPLEMKKISNKAAEDVLFELGKPEKRSHEESLLGSLQKKKKSKKSKSNDTTNTAETEKQTFIDRFHFKNMVPGTAALGQITKIDKMGLSVTVGDKLFGQVPITHISAEVSEAVEKYEKFVGESSDEESVDEEDGIKSAVKLTPELPDLQSLFKIGQWVSTVVIPSDAADKKILMSIEPEAVNASMEDDDLTPGNILQASVKSLEDHGVIFSLGFDNLSGFMSKKELKKAELPITDLRVGQVILTSVVQKSSRTVNLRPAYNENVAKSTAVTSISSIDAVHPGAIVNSIITSVTENGVGARVFGMADASFTLPHVEEYSLDKLKNHFAIGGTVRARVLGFIIAEGEKKFLLSRSSKIFALENKLNKESLEAFPVGFVFEEPVEIIGADKDFLYASMGAALIRGQIHKSNIDTDAGIAFYNPGTKHKARVIGFNDIDNLLILTMKPKAIDSQFVSHEDIPAGEYVPSAEVAKILPEGKGLVIKIFGEFEAFVPPNQLSDVKLVYPERKFREGGKVKARVLYKSGKRIFATVRKSLVNMDEHSIVNSFDNLEVGFKTSGIVDKFVGQGALITFFGGVRGYLPKTEISESFVEDARQYLKEGQAVSVRILNFDKEKRRIQVSLRQSTELSDNQIKHLEEIEVGRSIVNASIVEKTKETILVELEGSNLRGVLSTGQLSDGNYEQCRKVYKKLNVGETIPVLVLEKDLRARAVIVTIKDSLMNAAKSETFPVHYEDVHFGNVVSGYIRQVTSLGLFVTFAGRLTGLVLAKNATSNRNEDLSQKFYKNQSIACTVIKTDDENKRFLLSLTGQGTGGYETFKLKNPIDQSKSTINDFAVGTMTEGIITEVVPGFVKVRLADNLEGQIEAGQWCNSWKKIKNKKNPLEGVKSGEKLTAKVIGYYDNNRFTQISTHKKQTVVGLSVLDEVIKSKSPFKSTTLSDIEENSEHTVFIQSFVHGMAVVGLRPGVLAEIPIYNLTDDINLYKDFDNAFPLGGALRARVVGYEPEFNKVVLSARKNTVHSLEDIEVDKQYQGKVFKVAQNYVLVEVAKHVVGYCFISDALNDYSQNLQETVLPHTAAVVTVKDVNKQENTFQASMRDESIAKDKPVESLEELKRGDLVKGFVKAINNNGLYVSLGREVFALVRVADLSDAYLSDWKKYFKLWQVVTGKISQVAGQGRVLMTMKESEVNGDLTTFKTFDELRVGENYDGSVRKVADFGVFVKLDGTSNINGLCHISEIADTPLENVSALFGEGDRVKVKILAIDEDKKQLSLGMKASYFTDVVDGSDDVEMKEADSESEENSEDEVMENMDEDDEESSDDEAEEKTEPAAEGLTGLSTNGFDWTASILDQAEEEESSDDEEDFMDLSKKKRRKGKKQVEDRTAEMNSRAPQSVADFERLLVGNPDSSVLWMNYMSFQLQLGEVDKSREIAERALKTINYREEQEKMNIWIAILNLENSFGTDESLDVAFKRAAQYMDSLTMHQKLIGIFQLSEKFDKADSLYKTMVKKFGRNNVSVWVQYGSFLVDRERNEEAHEILARALQALPKRDHIEVVRKFAQLEFNKGDPEQGRSLFEGLVTDAPKRIDLWNVYIDQEIKQGDKERVVGLFERVVAKKLSRKQAKFFFSKWLSYEENNGTEQSAARVKALAVEYVQAHSAQEEA